MQLYRFSVSLRVKLKETGADGDHRHFTEIAERTISGCVRVVDLIEAINQTYGGVLPQDESRADSSWV